MRARRATPAVPTRASRLAAALLAAAVGLTARPAAATDPAAKALGLTAEQTIGQTPAGGDRDRRQRRAAADVADRVHARPTRVLPGVDDDEALAIDLDAGLAQPRGVGLGRVGPERDPGRALARPLDQPLGERDRRLLLAAARDADRRHRDRQRGDPDRRHRVARGREDRRPTRRDVQQGGQPGQRPDRGQRLAAARDPGALEPYLDGYGLLLAARWRADRALPALGPARAEDAAAIRGTLETLARAYPTPTPPSGAVPVPPGELLTQASRLKLRLGGGD